MLFAGEPPHELLLMCNAIMETYSHASLADAYDFNSQGGGQYYLAMGRILSQPA